MAWRTLEQSGRGSQATLKEAEPTRSAAIHPRFVRLHSFQRREALDSLLDLIRELHQLRRVGDESEHRQLAAGVALHSGRFQQIGGKVDPNLYDASTVLLRANLHRHVLGGSGP